MNEHGDSEHDDRAPTSPGSQPKGLFSGGESRAVNGLCAIYALRIVGLYMLLPVLSPYANALPGATSLLTGITLGAYGLTQAVFQIPFGFMSDRIGRRKTIFAGLLVFAAGSAVAALADTALLLIAGRLLQGAGAIASTVAALAADLTRPEVRTQAMARLGMWIGGAFAFGMIAGPFVAGLLGVPTLFWMTAVLSVLGASYLMVAVPAPRRREPEERVHRDELGAVLRQKPLAVLDGGSFLLHTALTAIFVILPFSLGERIGVDQIWKVVAPVVVIGLVAMALLARLSDQKGKTEQVFFLGGGALFLSCLIFAFAGRTVPGAFIGLIVFVLAIAALEPVLPSLTTRFASGNHRGAAMGVFHMSQFVGSFVGGLLGGAFLKAELWPLFGGIALLVLLWLAAARSVGGMTPRRIG